MRDNMDNKDNIDKNDVFEIVIDDTDDENEASEVGGEKTRVELPVEADDTDAEEEAESDVRSSSREAADEKDVIGEADAKDNASDDVGAEPDEAEDTDNDRGASGKKKKLPLWGKILIIVAAVLVVVGLTIWIGIKIYLGRINRIEETTRLPREMESFEPSTDEGVDTISADEVKWDQLYEDVKKDKEIKNIILIGQDRRPTETEPARSESMILCSINKRTNQITLISFMRDMYVPIPGYSDNRINAAYNYGGASLLKETIQQDFGVEIDNAIEVDFEGFIKAMTAVGDLEIELSQEEADYLNEIGTVMNAEAGLTGGNWNLHAGKNMLKPDQALAYSRTRYVGRSDWERTDRQRRVLMAAFGKVSQMSVSEQLDLVNAVIPYFATDMTDNEILGYVYYIAKEGIHVGETFRVPADGAYTNERINNMAVLVPNLQKNSDLIKESLYK